MTAKIGQIDRFWRHFPGHKQACQTFDKGEALGSATGLILGSIQGLDLGFKNKAITIHK